MISKHFRKKKYIFNDLIVGIIIYSKDLTLLYSNQSAYDILGFPVQYLTNKCNVESNWSLIDADGETISESDHPVNLVISTKKSVDNYKMGIKNYDNHYITWVNVCAYPIFDNKNTLEKIIVNILDVTGLIETESALRESERKLREAYNMARIGYWYWDIHTGDVDWSEEVYKIFHLDPAKYIPKIDSILEMSPWPEYHKRGDELIKIALSNHTPGSYEQKFLCPDGSIGYYFSTYQGVYDDRNSLVGIRGTVQDITERKNLEEELKTQQYYLTKAQEIGKIGTWELDIPRNILRWTDENYRVFGVKPGTKLTYETFLDCVHPEDREFVDTTWKAAMKGEPYVIEHRLLVDNKVKWVRQKAELEYDENGNCLRGTGFTQDISERKQFEEKLRNSEKMQAIGQLSGGIAHEFNNKLAGILGFAELIQKKVIDPVLVDYAEKIIQASIKSRDLTQQLLAFARKGKYRSSNIDIHQTAEEVVSLLSQTFDKNIIIEKQYNAHYSKVLGDPTQIQNIIFNLALNSRDAMPDGGKLIFTTENVYLDNNKIKDKTHEIKSGDYIKISIADTGCGIKKEIFSKIFEPFFTTKSVGEGTGMGLASVYGAVETHKGTIEVKSELNKGSTFNIYLPVYDSVTPEIKKNKYSNLSVLLVDDEEIVITAITAMLEDLGHNVTNKTNGKDALLFYKDNWKSIDVVILDLIMPGMGGEETFMLMKMINPNIKCIISSGYSMNGHTQEIIKKGAIGFIHKPYNLKELSEIINTI